MVLLYVGVFVDEGSEFEAHHGGILEFEHFGEDRQYVRRRTLFVTQEGSAADLAEEILEWRQRTSN